MAFKIRTEELYVDLVGATPEFPRYTTQLINLANQNAQGTRPKVVGQMSDLIEQCPGRTYEDWTTWYTKQHPSAIKDATGRIMTMLDNLRKALAVIDENLVRQWVTDLVLSKTFVGLRFQDAVLRRVSQLKGTSYRRATPAEESKGIDGYIGDCSVSIKPDTYKSKSMLGESISARLIFYKKLKDGIEVSFDF